MTKLLAGLMAAAALAFASWSPAQAAYPEKPVQFVIPWPPGDLEDVLTRIIADHMQKETGVATAVVNRPGGGGGPFPGAAEVARAAPDGYTIGSFVISVPIVGPMRGIEGLQRDTFEPIGIFLSYPFVVVAKQDAPYSSMKELAEYAKTNKVALGHFGYGLVPTRATFLAAKELGFEFGSEAAFDNVDCNTLASGDADVINTTIQLVLPCLDKVKVLAAITGERISLVPDVPTLGEQVAGADIELWNGLFVPKGTPQEVKQRIAEIAQEALQSEEAQKVAETTGALIYWIGAEQAQARIEADYKKIEDIFRRMGDL